MKKPAAANATVMKRPSTSRVPSAGTAAQKKPANKAADPPKKKPAVQMPANTDNPPQKKPSFDSSFETIDVSQAKVLNVANLKVKYVIRKPVIVPDWNNLHWRPKLNAKGEIVTYQHEPFLLRTEAAPSNGPMETTSTTAAPSTGPMETTSTTAAPSTGPMETTVNPSTHTALSTGHMQTTVNECAGSDDEDSEDGSHPHVPTPTSSPTPVDVPEATPDFSRATLDGV